MVTVERAKKWAKTYYDEKTYLHASRVAKYVEDNPLIPITIKERCKALAWMHDLVEDTRFTLSKVDEDEIMKQALSLITKPAGCSYSEYCIKISDNRGTQSGSIAYWVKMADMKDHLNLVETLTEKRKRKYLEGLRWLL